MSECISCEYLCHGTANNVVLEINIGIAGWAFFILVMEVRIWMYEELAGYESVYLQGMYMLDKSIAWWAPTGEDRYISGVLTCLSV